MIHLDPIYKQLGLLILSEINTYLIEMFMFKFYHNDAPSILQEFVTKIMEFMNITIGLQTIRMFPNVLQT